MKHVPSVQAPAKPAALNPDSPVPADEMPVEASPFRHSIASDVVLSGRIHFPGNARVDGRLKGEVHADGLLLIGAQAEVEARIRAQHLVIEGTFSGDVIESGVVEITSSGRVFGSIEALALTIAPGARFEGRIQSALPEERTRRKTEISSPALESETPKEAAGSD